MGLLVLAGVLPISVVENSLSPTCLAIVHNLPIVLRFTRGCGDSKHPDYPIN